MSIEIFFFIEQALFPVLHTTNIQPRHVERNGSDKGKTMYKAGNVSTQPVIYCTKYM
jgi:hypothetical protein